MIKVYSFIIGMVVMMSVQAQPYIDIAQFNYMHSPDAGLWRRNNRPNIIDHLSDALNIPFVFKQDSSIILIGPNVQRWDINFKGAPDNNNHLPGHFYTLVLPLTFIKPLAESWTLTLSVIPRWNGYNSSVFKNAFQLGAAVLTSFKKADKLVLKAGLYYNAELSGPFFMPLLGVDWQIGKKDNLYGILPGSLAYEHKFYRKLFAGLNFKAITNTYDAGSTFYNSGNGIVTNEKYLRIDENQLNLFFDFYFSKELVLNIAAGHAVLRKIRLGLKDLAGKYYYTEKMNDDLLLTFSFNYRLRMKGR